MFRQLRSSSASSLFALVVVLGGVSGHNGLRAGPIKITFDSLGAYEAATIHYQGHDESAYAGQFHMHYATGPDTGTTFNSFCVDLDHYVSGGQTYLVNPRSTGDGLNHGAEIAYLYNKYGRSTLTDNAKAAGLQLALWDEVVDGGDGLSAGTFQVVHGSAAALADANAFLAEAHGKTGSALWLDATPNGTDRYRGQSVLAPASGPGVAAVPEPTTLALLAAGLAGFAACRWLTRGRRLAATARR